MAKVNKKKAETKLESEKESATKKANEKAEDFGVGTESGLKNYTEKQKKQILEQYKKINRLLKEIEFRNKKGEKHSVTISKKDASFFPNLGGKTLCTDAAYNDSGKNAISVEMAWAQVDGMLPITFEDVMSVLRSERAKEFLGICKNNVKIARDLVGMAHLAQLLNGNASDIQKLSACLFYGLDKDSLNVMKEFFNVKMSGEFMSSLEEIQKTAKNLTRDEMKMMGRKGLTTFGAASMVQDELAEELITGKEVYSVNTITATHNNSPFTKKIAELENVLENQSIIADIVSNAVDRIKTAQTIHEKMEARKEFKHDLAVEGARLVNVGTASQNNAKKEEELTNADELIRTYNEEMEYLRFQIETEKKKPVPDIAKIEQLEARKIEYSRKLSALGHRYRAVFETEAVVYGKKDVKAGIETDKKALDRDKRFVEIIRTRMQEVESSEGKDDRLYSYLETILHDIEGTIKSRIESIENGVPMSTCRPSEAEVGSEQWIIDTYGSLVGNDEKQLRRDAINAIEAKIERFERYKQLGILIPEYAEEFENLKKYLSIMKEPEERFKQDKQAQREEAKQEKKKDPDSIGELESVEVKEDEATERQERNIERSKGRIYRYIESLSKIAQREDYNSVFAKIQRECERVLSILPEGERDIFMQGVFLNISSIKENEMFVAMTSANVMEMFEHKFEGLKTQVFDMMESLEVKHNSNEAVVDYMRKNPILKDKTKIVVQPSAVSNSFADIKKKYLGLIGAEEEYIFERRKQSQTQTTKSIGIVYSNLYEILRPGGYTRKGVTLQEYDYYSRLITESIAYANEYQFDDLVGESLTGFIEKLKALQQMLDGKKIIKSQNLTTLKAPEVLKDNESLLAPEEEPVTEAPTTDVVAEVATEKKGVEMGNSDALFDESENGVANPPARGSSLAAEKKKEEALEELANQIGNKPE